MVKKSRKQSGEEQHTEEAKGVEAEPVELSDAVLVKKENAKQMKAAVKKMESHVKQSLDSKQIISAVKALQKYQKKKTEAGAKKNLL